MNRRFDLKDIHLTSVTFWICALEERMLHYFDVRSSDGNDPKTHD